MPYQVDRFNGTPLVVVDEGTVNNEKTTLKLVGKNYAGYGEIQNENFVFLSENFANPNSPPNALVGQTWYDSANKKLKFFVGNEKWKTTGGSEVGPTPPIGLSEGDFWWNTVTNQLYTYNGIDKYILVGPQAVEGAGETGWLSVSVVDTDGNLHAIIKGIVDGDCIVILSTDSFTLNSTINPITGFSYIRQGTTLRNSASGSTTTTHRYWGTASDSDKLGGKDGSEYVLASNAVFTNSVAVARFPDSGFTVGNDNDLRVQVVNGSVVTIENQVSNLLKFVIKDGVTSKNVMNIEGGTVVPGVTDTYDLGTALLRWRKLYAKDVYADNFYGGTFTGTFSGISDKAKFLLYAGDYRSATDQNTPNTIVARDISGNFSANVINATATKAQYADLAEKYEADKVYEPGTVVIFGGEKEITLSFDKGNHRVAGVISTAPAYVMNDSKETESFLPVALRGKVPVKVTGLVRKGDLLVTSEYPGYAESVGDGENVSPHAVFAKALENKTDNDSGVIMAVIL